MNREQLIGIWRLVEEGGYPAVGELLLRYQANGVVISEYRHQGTELLSEDPWELQYPDVIVTKYTVGPTPGLDMEEMSETTRERILVLTALELVTEHTYKPGLEKKYKRVFM